MQIMLKIAIAICNGIYEIHKLFPVRNRIAMVSRQSKGRIGTTGSGGGNRHAEPDDSTGTGG